VYGSLPTGQVARSVASAGVGNEQQSAVKTTAMQKAPRLRPGGVRRRAEARPGWAALLANAVT
jgi:hypothetical protein